MKNKILIIIILLIIPVLFFVFNNKEEKIIDSVSINEDSVIGKNVSEKIREDLDEDKEKLEMMRDRYESYDRDKTKWLLFEDKKYGFSFMHPAQTEVVSGEPKYESTYNYTQPLLIYSVVDIVDKEKIGVYIAVHSKKEDFKRDVLGDSSVVVLDHVSNQWRFDMSRGPDNSLVFFGLLCDPERDRTEKIGKGDFDSVRTGDGDAGVSTSVNLINTGDYLYNLEADHGEGNFIDGEFSLDILNTFDVFDRSSVITPCD